jgi:hypothetical protein
MRSLIEISGLKKVEILSMGKRKKDLTWLYYLEEF